MFNPVNLEKLRLAITSIVVGESFWKYAHTTQCDSVLEYIVDHQKKLAYRDKQALRGFS